MIVFSVCAFLVAVKLDWTGFIYDHTVRALFGGRRSPQTLVQKDGAASSELSRFAGEWRQGAYRTTVTVSGATWSGTFQADFNDSDPNHRDTDGRIYDVEQDGSAFVGKWMSSYSDSQKSGRRWGTFKIRLVLGATPMEDRIVGDWVEQGDEMVKANPGTAMSPGHVWPVDWRWKE